MNDVESISFLCPVSLIPPSLSPSLSSPLLTGVLLQQTGHSPRGQRAGNEDEEAEMEVADAIPPTPTPTPPAPTTTTATTHTSNGQRNTSSGVETPPSNAAAAALQSGVAGESGSREGGREWKVGDACACVYTEDGLVVSLLLHSYFICRPACP